MYIYVCTYSPSYCPSLLLLLYEYYCVILYMYCLLCRHSFSHNRFCDADSSAPQVHMRHLLRAYADSQTSFALTLGRCEWPSSEGPGLRKVESLARPTCLRNLLQKSFARCVPVVLRRSWWALCRNAVIFPPLQKMATMTIAKNDYKYAKSAFRTNSVPIYVFLCLYFIFLNFAHLGWIRIGHDITNPFVQCRFNVLFTLCFS